MHEILSPLKRGINISQRIQKAIDRRLPQSSRVIKRISLSDAETIDLLDGQQYGRDDFGYIQKRLHSFLTQEGDFRPGYRLKVESNGHLNFFTTREVFQPVSVGQLLENNSKSGPRAYFWGPKLSFGNDGVNDNAKFLLDLELPSKPKIVEGRGSGEQSVKESEVEDTNKEIQLRDRMKSWAQIVTTPTADTPGTIMLLYFDNSRYLFGNVSEGIYRICVQGRASLSKVHNFFLTGTVNWHTAGGVLGLLLSQADTMNHLNAERLKQSRERKTYFDPAKLALHGGKNLNHLLATARRFVFRKGVPLDVHEIKADHELSEARLGDRKPTFTDENIKVWAMPIKSDTSSTTTRKRSHEEMSENMHDHSKAPIFEDEMSTEEREYLEDQIRKGIVSHMFDSDWQLDALKAMKLQDVKMPAAIFIRNSNGNIEKYKGILPGGDDLVPDIEVLVRMPWPGAAIESLPPTSPSMESMSYIVKNKPQRGKFNRKQAELLGVMEGGDYGKLAAGKSVTTADGKIVTPDMVMGPGKEGGGFAIVDLPNESYIDNLINRPEWSSEEIMDGIGAIVWIIEKGLREDARLLDFLRKHSELSHIISSPEDSPNRLTHDGASVAAIRMNKVDPERYPIPLYDNEHPSSNPSIGLKASPGLTIQLEPKWEILSDRVYPLLDIAEVRGEDDTEVQKLAEIARKTISDPAYLAHLDSVQQDLPSKDAEVIILGSGSAMPSKYRNVTGTLIRVPGYGNYLFDCGENSLGQMKRLFGAELPQVLRELKVIWISHLHADHHLGITSVIKEWRDEMSKDQATLSNRLMIASERDMLEWLEEYSQVEDFGYSRLHLVGMNGHKLSRKEFNESETETYGLSSIEACPVDHCKGALAGIFTFPNGFKVAYSGDCLPSPEFARAAKGATLLIHEATFDDELAGDANAKKHCTTSEALWIGKLMGARRILLTHFSQRYQRIPVIENKGDADQVVIVAFDYMRVKIGDFAKVEHFKPALIELYKDKKERWA